MPQCLIEAPVGISPDAKRTMMREVSDAIAEAFPIPDVRIWLREYATDNVAQDGEIGIEPIRPLCFLEVPQLKSLDAKRKMSGKIDTAIAKAYRDLANTNETLILINHYPLENAFAAGLQADKPEIVAAIDRLNE
jgi:hypothetical protein